MTSMPSNGRKVKGRFSTKWSIIGDVSGDSWAATGRLVVILLAMQLPADVLTLLVMRR
jgi:hypothetical protein